SRCLPGRGWAPWRSPRSRPATSRWSRGPCSTWRRATCWRTWSWICPTPCWIPGCATGGGGGGGGTMEGACNFRRKRGAMAGLIVLTALVLGSVLAPWLSPYDPYEPGPQRLAPPSREHLLGTDPLGRDVFSRILHGGRVSLQVGILAVGIALVTGTVLGLVAAYFEGWVDNVIMRVI